MPTWSTTWADYRGPVAYIGDDQTVVHGTMIGADTAGPFAFIALDSGEIAKVHPRFVHPESKELRYADKFLPHSTYSYSYTR
jgi:hypothetical protein